MTTFAVCDETIPLTTTDIDKSEEHLKTLNMYWDNDDRHTGPEDSE